MKTLTRVGLFTIASLLTASLPAQTPATPSTAASDSADRPFGTLREQAALQQEWLQKRLDTFLPALLRKHGIDLWVVPMREYNEDPVFAALTSPETFAARRRTIYVFFDKCAAAGTPPAAVVRRAHRARRHRRRAACSRPRRSTQPRPANVGTRAAGRALGRRAVAGCSRRVIEERHPRVIGIDRSTVFAFSDGLSSGELKG